MTLERAVIIVLALFVIALLCLCAGWRDHYAALQANLDEATSPKPYRVDLHVANTDAWVAVDETYLYKFEGACPRRGF